MPAKYDRIGKKYNNTRKADPYLLLRMVKLLKINSQGIYLDIGCGTGNYAIELNKYAGSFIGVDPSAEMLKNARALNSEINWKKGTAEKIPLENNKVDGVVASLTIHHWGDLNKGFDEINRVLKENGRLVIFTSTPKQMDGYWLNYYFPTILKKSIQQMPSFELVEDFLLKNNFKNIQTEKYFIQLELQDLFLYSGKHRPEFYLNEKVRNGISSFSDLANEEEIETGLQILKEDMEAGNLPGVIDSYENDRGDYLFIVAEK